MKYEQEQKTVFRRAMCLISIIIFLSLPSWGGKGIVAETEKVKSVRLPSGRVYNIYAPNDHGVYYERALVIFLYGGGEGVEKVLSPYYGWLGKAASEGFILAVPEAISSSGGATHKSSWNAGDCCGYAMRKHVDDVGNIRDIIADIESRHNIDKKKIFVAGMSNGGMLAYRLACEMPEMISAIAAVAGTDNTTECQPRQPLSVLHIHAVHDTKVPYNGGASGASTHVLNSVPRTVASWVRFNGLDGAPRQISLGPNASGKLYTSEVRSTRVFLVTMANGGHSWPSLQNPAANALSATDLIWRFFSGEFQRGSDR